MRPSRSKNLVRMLSCMMRGWVMFVLSLREAVDALVGGLGPSKWGDRPEPQKIPI